MITAREEKGLTAKGWPAVGLALMMATNWILTALAASFPNSWLVNHVFAASAIHAIFGTNR